MVGTLRHRGPDAAGVYLDQSVGLGHARLSIVDLSGGLQPLTNEDGTIWLICNGEVFNFVELTAELESRGHRFRTASDSETIVHLYEELGLDCVHALNGQFAFALWDTVRQRLVLGRDRMGIRPLFYTNVGSTLVFGSEIKALLAHPAVPRELDPVGLGQVFRTWSPLPPRTMFKGVSSLRPGHLLVVNRDGRRIQRYWQPRFDCDRAPVKDAQEAAEQLRDLLTDATRIRLRADVPVAAYVSGGLDSSATAALARRELGASLETFAVAFDEGEFDERAHQERVARSLGTRHHTITCQAEDIARVFPDVVWHAETPLLRTAPAPLYLLAGLTSAHGLKVVLTGEGADEVLLGYDIFKETKVRAFWADQPGSRLRPALLKRLYTHIPELSRPSSSYLQAFFGAGLDQARAPGFSHLLRWQNTSRLHGYFTDEVRAAIEAAGDTELDALLESQASIADPVARAQQLEMATFLDPYLLASQGDRMTMAHGVEGRFPFLDYRLVEFCNALPAHLKMPGLHEKVLLKRATADLVPPEVLARPKQPFRAPIRAAFAGPHSPDYVREVLDPRRLAADGIFKSDKVSWLLRRATQTQRMGEVDHMALVGLVSYGLFRRAFWDEYTTRASGRTDDIVTLTPSCSPALETTTV
jgi:asparagine synthase (glutamine-hydrolysing)